jgi:hypothetical protein
MSNNRVAVVRIEFVQKVLQHIIQIYKLHETEFGHIKKFMEIIFSYGTHKGQIIGITLNILL